MNIIIDSRESSLKKLFFDSNGNDNGNGNSNGNDNGNGNSNGNSNIKIEQLDIGDVIIKRQNKILCIIERKTYVDYASSIKDGRNKNQTYRIDEYMKNNPDVDIIYLIEGNSINEQQKTSTIGYSKISYDSVYSSLCNKMIKNDFKIVWCGTVNDSFYFINKLFSKYCEFYKGQEGREDHEGREAHEGREDEETYIDTIKLSKKNMMTPANYYICILSQIPSISTNIANIISFKYSSLKELINQLTINKDETIKIISNLTHSNSKRRLGMSVGNKLYEYLLA